MRFSILSLLILFNAQVFSQSKTCDKAEKLYNEKKYTAADKTIDKCLLERDMGNNSNLLLLKSKIQYQIFLDKSLAEKYPSALKEALKYAEKALEAIGQGLVMQAFKQTNAEYYQELTKSNNKEALFAYNGGKYAKALPLFKRSIYFGMDTMSLVYGADCYWYLDETDEAVTLYKRSAEILYASVLDSTLVISGFHRTPFVHLAEYYIKKGHLDSAYIYVKNGREILPNDPDLNDLTYKLMKSQLDKIPPSFDYLSFIKNGLKDFPSDSFLNHRENSIYIFLLNGMAQGGEFRQFDSLFQIYAKSKTDKAGSSYLSKIKKYDIFAGMGLTDFTTTMIDYFANSNLDKASYYMAKIYMNQQDTAASKPEVMAKLIPNLASTRNIDITYRNAAEEFPKNAALNKSMSDYTLKKNKSELGYYDLLPLIHLNERCMKINPKVSEFNSMQKILRMRLINESSDTGDFKLCRTIWAEASKMYPDQSANLEQAWKKMVINDFKYNYYGSRINLAGKIEKGIPNYIWNGVADSCKWGSIADDVVLSLQDRINYFRRMSGMTEMISLTRQDNEVCMIAAMMCEANRSMSHNPNDGWRCFIPAGFDALQNAILSKDANPSIAITAAMGQNHATVGNRRWLLYPNALYMGMGTSKSYTAIKAIDNSRGIDTLKYQSQFVAWPPVNACPKMLVFKKWSFSIDLDLNGAVVTMKDAKGQAVELKQEPYVVGYGMNTIVWEPSINLASLADDSIFQVQVKLKNGKTFNYKVKIIDVKI